MVNARDFGVPQDRERVIICGFRKDWNQVSYTIPAMAKQVTLYPGSPDMVKIDRDLWRFGADGETRRLSWREAAAIQTFPVDLGFYGDLTSKYKQIGNAVEHRRLSDTIDFGKEWLGHPCSANYFEKVVPLFNELRKIRDNSKAAGSPTLWCDITQKADRYYVPVLQEFMEELKRMVSVSKENIPERLVQYLIGRHDFYKAITDDHNRTPKVEAVNAVCDEGWQISMRIHSASSRVEPSLEFDVNLISLPSTAHTQIEPWDYDIEADKKERLGIYALKFFE